MASYQYKKLTLTNNIIWKETIDNKDRLAGEVYGVGGICGVEFNWRCHKWVQGEVLGTFSYTYKNIIMNNIQSLH